MPRRVKKPTMPKKRTTKGKALKGSMTIETEERVNQRVAWQEVVTKSLDCLQSCATPAQVVYGQREVKGMPEYSSVGAYCEVTMPCSPDNVKTTLEAVIDMVDDTLADELNRLTQ